MNQLSGCLLINKKAGVTSRAEVNEVSKILGTKKVGHIGTLDPFATGLLIVLVGSATKISPFLERHNKTYIATIALGKKTDSGDLTGNIIEEKPVPKLTIEKISEVLQSFLGESEQIPPMYSAIKKDGKPLYAYARKGEEVERKPRKITIYDIKLITYSDASITFVAKVSKGTYVRTLGEDIAEKLGTVGHLSELERTMIDNFNVKDAIKAEDVSSSKLLSIEKMLKDFPSINVSGEIASKVKNGVPLFLKCDNEEVLIKDEDGIIAMYKRNENSKYTCLRGLR
ncbi:MAG: tRNA pseudouridine(55) synthase TruB [Bacilli bacterium]|nr:tRNA pseudouridine(55) synthase TruB [Bacilli bacterium]